MYSRNDYRYYLEHRYTASDNYLMHYGVLGMKWGVRNDNRRASLVSKRDSNTVKINKYKTKLNTVGAKKRAAKAAKYQVKQDKYDKKAAKARKRLAAGKHISTGQLKKIQKAEKYRAKVARNSVKNDAFQAKIAKLEKRNVKLNKKINKLDYKSTRNSQISNLKTDVPVRKLRSNYNKSYKHATKSMKRMGSSADNYRVNKIDNYGRVTSLSPVWNNDPVLRNVNKK